MFVLGSGSGGHLIPIHYMTSDFLAYHLRSNEFSVLIILFLHPSQTKPGIPLFFLKPLNLQLNSLQLEV